MDFREFNRSFKDLYERQQRALPDYTNKKAYYVTRRWLYETPIVARETITNELGKVTRSGRHGKNIKLQLTHAETSDAPLAALIVNKQRGKRGLPGLFGKRMIDAIAALIGTRQKSRGYLRSGLLPALRKLAASFGGHAPQSMAGARQYGRDKGDAIPARPGWTVKATIVNAADSKDGRAALFKHGIPALQRAIDLEAASMREEVLRRIGEEARRAGIRVLG